MCYAQQNISTSLEGVEINGVRWATRNVAARGTFASNPESAGNFFNWNEAQGVCPPGWRLPTETEFQRLIGAGSTWTRRNGVFGRLFAGQLFLPVAHGTRGIYWSSSPCTHIAVARSFEFESILRPVVSREPHTAGLSVRCVAFTEADIAAAEQTRAAEEAQRAAAEEAQRQASQQAQNISTALEGVEINGVRWATRNVDAPGTFAANPESEGMFFQWNRHDSCPPGWRVPTQAEIRSLSDAGSSWTTRNGVYGRLFGTAPNQLFLPADRRANRAALPGVYVYSSSEYWSSSPNTALSFSRLDILVVERNPSITGLVRCVVITEADIAAEAARIAREAEAARQREAAEAARQREAEARQREAEHRRQQEEQARIQQQQQDQHGVLINDVRWATRNVAAPGTFAPNPESAGMHFQWNRRQGWATTIGNVSGWRSSRIRGTTWERANDPCPPGWRVPTQAELQRLHNAGSIWTTRNGVYGRLFGIAPNQIFLPAAGRRYVGGTLSFSGGAHGYYWSSSPGTRTANAMRLQIQRGNSHVYHNDRAGGLSVRCVVE